MKKKILFVSGTRPEIIKLAPLYFEFKVNSDIFEVQYCHTGQHQELAKEVFNFFQIVPDYELDAMRNSSSLSTMVSYLLARLEELYESVKPDLVIVHGDTNSTLCGAVGAFHKNIKVAHVEAGLRSGDLQSPFPEEMNRRMVSVVTNYHFAPTVLAKNNLLNEGIDKNKIFLVGNTVIDALGIAQNIMAEKTDTELEQKYDFIDFEKKIILFTGHRRENLDGGLKKILLGFNKVLKERSDVEVVFPVHLNPRVQDTVQNTVDHKLPLHTLSHLSYRDFLWFMKKCYFVVTDSGGIQEEAPSFGKPVLVTRDTTERKELLESGGGRLIGAEKEVLISTVNNLLDDVNLYSSMRLERNPYGDGKSSKRILNEINRLIG